MAKFYTNFSDAPTLTERWHTTAGSTIITTSGLPSGAGSHALVMTGSFGERYAVSWDNVGTVTGDVDLLFKWYVDVATNDKPRGIIHGSGTDTNESAYIINLDATNASAAQTLVRYSNASAANIDAGTQTLTTQKWYYTRIKKVGDVVSASTWAEGSAEPSTAQLAASDAALTSGWVGFGQFYHTGTLYIAEAAVGTNGDVAEFVPQETVDAFTDNSLDLTKWTNISANGGSVSETNGRLQATLPSGVNSPVGGVYGPQENFYGEKWSVELVQSPAHADASTYVEIRASNVSSDSIMFMENGGTLYARKRVGGVLTTILSTAYDPVQHRFLRFRQVQSRTYWETSNNGVNWVSRANEINPINLSTARLYLSLSSSRSTTTTHTAIFDNVNTFLNTYERTVSGNAIAALKERSRTVPSSIQTVVQSEERVVSNVGITTLSTRRFVPASMLLAETPSIDEIITALRGPVSYSFGMRTYDTNGNALSDVSDSVSNITIDFNMQNAIKRTISFDVETSCATLFDENMVEPYVTISVFDTKFKSQLNYQFSLGRFVQTSRKHSVRTTGNTRGVDGEDRCVWLTSKEIEETVTINTGTNYGVEIRNQLLAAGFSDADIDIPSTTLSTPAPLTFEEGTTTYAIIAKLAEAINWSEPYMNNEDKVVIFQREDKTNVEPDVVYATDSTSMILPDINFQVVTEDVVNAVTVTVNDPLRVPFAQTYYNDHPDNPYSRSVTGKTHVKVLENLNHLESGTIALDRAKLEAQIASANRTLELKTWLDPRRKPFENYYLYVTCPETGNTVISSMWECVGWKMSLTASGEMSHQLRNIMPV